MAMRQLVETTTPNQISFAVGGKTKIEDQFLKQLNESKGIVTSSQIDFRDKTGEMTVSHSGRDWKLYKSCYQKVGVVSNAIDNTANFAIQSGYELEGSQGDKDKVRKWIEENNFNQIILNIMKQMQVFGNAYLEISDKPKLLPVDSMYVVVKKGTDNDGEIVGYKQRVKIKDEVKFEPDEIIHFKWREIGTDFYGLSDIEPNLGILTKLLNFQEDVGDIMHHYAHPIVHYKLGTEEIPATDKQVNDFEAMKNNMKVGQDLITSANVKSDIIAANLKLIQIDGLIRHMENQLIAGLQVPEIFIRGGQTSNKATAGVELQSFDRRVKALRAIVSTKLHDEFFLPKLKADVMIGWHEMSVEAESLKSEMMVNLRNAGVPTKVALMMTGWGSWIDDYEKAKEEEPEPQPMMPQPPMKKNEEPKEENFDNQEDWLKSVEEWKNKYK